MAPSRRSYSNAFLLAALFAAPLVHAQLSDVPNLSTATQATDLTSSETSSSESSTSESSTTASTTESTSDATSTAAVSTSVSTGASTTVSELLTNAPTIAGAGVPAIGVPDTAGAPYMQKSNLPEGTVFIIVGAILGFFGACILFWRALVAWSINRSVKRAALASVRGHSEKSYGGRGHNPAKGSTPYHDHSRNLAAAGSNMDLEPLTSTGKPINKPFRDADVVARSSTPPPPSSLFFSPTAEARQSVVGLSRDNNLPPGSGNNRSSSAAFLPAGYYASPSAQAANGDQRMTIGGSIAPYARPASTYSPPTSANIPPSSHRVSTGGARATSRDALRPPHSRESSALASSSRPGSYMDRNSYVQRSASPSLNLRSASPSYIQRSASPSYMQRSASPSYMQRSASPALGTGDYNYQSSSSLAINMTGSHLGASGLRQGASTGSDSGLGGSRAPSAYFEDLMENHGMGPRERF